MQSVAESSPRPSARTIGVVYLLYFVTAVIGALLMKGVVVPTDAVATAQNLLAHETLYRSGWEVSLIANAFYIATTALFYGLLAPVNRSLAVMMAFFSLAGCTVQIVGGLLQVAPFTILGDTQLAGAFTVAQMQSAALLSYKLYPLVFNTSLVLFALFDFLLGYLIYESTFLPRFIGSVVHDCRCGRADISLAAGGNLAEVRHNPDRWHRGSRPDGMADCEGRGRF